MSNYGNTTIIGAWPPALAALDARDRVSAIRDALGFRADANVRIEFGKASVKVTGTPGYRDEPGCDITGCIIENPRPMVIDLPPRTWLSASPFADDDRDRDRDHRD